MDFSEVTTSTATINTATTTEINHPQSPGSSSSFTSGPAADRQQHTGYEIPSISSTNGLPNSPAGSFQQVNNHNLTTTPSSPVTPAGTATPLTTASPTIHRTLSRQDSQLHATDATPPIFEKSIEPIQDMAQRLLGLRGSPPGTNTNLSADEIKTLCQHAKTHLLSQPMLIELEAPIKICGDVHGQYTDLLRLFEYGGFPPVSNYLFLGDYVDRGKQSIETICLLLAYKIQYPVNFFILRGNHESAGINRIYGFYDECKRRYSIKLWKIFSDVFNCLPVAALIDDKILCMHGGLSPDLRSLQQIADLQRPCDIPDKGLLCDLLWSDPMANMSVRTCCDLFCFIFAFLPAGPFNHSLDSVFCFCSLVPLHVLFFFHQN